MRLGEEIKVDIEMEEVNSFGYVVRYVRRDGTIWGVSTGIDSATAAFEVLDNVWRSSAYETY